MPSAAPTSAETAAACRRSRGRSSRASAQRAQHHAWASSDLRPEDQREERRREPRPKVRADALDQTIVAELEENRVVEFERADAHRAQQEACARISHLAAPAKLAHRPVDRAQERTQVV